MMRPLAASLDAAAGGFAGCGNWRLRWLKSHTSFFVKHFNIGM